MADTDIDIDALSDGILAKLKKSLGRRGGDDDFDDLDSSGSGRVPMHRFRQVVAERNEARAALEEMSNQVAQLKQGYEQKLQAFQAETADEVKAIGQRHAEDLQLVDLGLRDPLGRKALRDAWSAQPKESRGKSPIEWWQGTLEARKAHAADPEKAAAPTIPTVLSGYLPQLEDAAGGKGGGGQSQGSGGPGGRTPPKGPSARVPTEIGDIKPDVGIAGLVATLRQQNA